MLLELFFFLCSRHPRPGGKTRWTSPNMRSILRWTPSQQAPHPWSISLQVKMLSLTTMASASRMCNTSDQWENEPAYLKEYFDLVSTVSSLMGTVDWKQHRSAHIMFFETPETPQISLPKFQESRLLSLNNTHCIMKLQFPMLQKQIFKLMLKNQVRKVL